MMGRYISKLSILTGALGIAVAAPSAWADELRPLCADRPGLGTPACVTDSGHVTVEMGLADWAQDRDSGTVTDTLSLGDGLIKAGVNDTLELQLGWNSYTHIHMRDRLAGGSTNASGVGDITLAARQNLRNPDGSGFSLAVMPYVSLPVGAKAVSDGDWGAGLLVPMSVDLGSGMSLGLTPEIDAAVDSDGDGRHLAFSGVAGLGFSLSNTLSFTTEIAFLRDLDPSDHESGVLGGLSLGWQPAGDLQLDMGLNLGHGPAVSDLEIYAGIVRRF